MLRQKIKYVWETIIKSRKTELDPGTPVRLPVIASFSIVPVFTVFLIIIFSILSNYMPFAYFPMGIVLACLLVFIAMYIKSAKLYPLVIIFLIAFAVRMLVVMTYDMEPINDFKRTYDVAYKLAGTPISDWATVTQDTMYYNQWVTYMPFILFETIVMKIFELGILPLKIVFAMSTALTCLFAGLIANKIGGPNAGTAAALLLAFNPTIILYTPVLTNQHTATMLFVVGIYFIVNRPFKTVVLNDAMGVLFFVFSHLLRPEMYIALIALVCLYIIKLICYLKEKGADKVFAVRRLAASFTVLALFFVLIWGVMTALSGAGLIKESEIDQTGYKIAVGLNTESRGRVNKEDMLLTQQDNYDFGPLIKQRLENKLALIKLMSEKTVYQWAFYNYHWSYAHDKNPLLIIFVPPAVNGYMLVVFVMGAATLILSCGRVGSAQLFLIILCLGYFLVFAVIEVQTRYNYLLIPVFTVLATQAVKWLTERWTYRN